MGLRARYGSPDPEILDDTPLEMPLGARRPTPLHDIIARMVRDAVSQETGDVWETPEEADDFEEEDPDTLDFSPYEFDELSEEFFDPPEDPVPPEPQQTGDAPDPNEPEPDTP